MSMECSRKQIAQIPREVPARNSETMQYGVQAFAEMNYEQSLGIFKALRKPREANEAGLNMENNQGV